MNNLSWLLYFGDIAGSLSSFFGWMSAPIFVLMIGFIVAGAINMLDCGPDHHEYVVYWTMRNIGLKIFMPMFFGFAILACIIPSKETVYLIAASEAGETVVKSETGKKALDAVNRYLDRVAPVKKDEDSN